MQITNDQAIVLEACTITQYLTIFSDKPLKEAIEANKVLREVSLITIKELMLSRIAVTEKIIKQYSAGLQSKLINIDKEIDRQLEGVTETKLTLYNDHIVAVFRAANMPVNKSISMLDFQNIKDQIIKEYKNNLLKKK